MSPAMLQVLGALAAGAVMGGFGVVRYKSNRGSDSQGPSYVLKEDCRETHTSLKPETLVTKKDCRENHQNDPITRAEYEADAKQNREFLSEFRNNVRDDIKGLHKKMDAMLLAGSKTT